MVPMCLGVPGKIVEVLPERTEGSGGPTAGLRMGVVDFGGVRKEVCLSCVERAGPGDYVIVHAGFALQTIDAEEAAEVFRLLKEMEEASREDMEPGGPPAAEGP